MKIKTLKCIIALLIIFSCPQLSINIKQATALQAALTNKDMQDIQKVIDKSLSGFAANNIDDIMETISPDYSKSIGGAIINYAGLKELVEKNSADFFTDHISCSLSDIKILSSNIVSNKVTIKYEYTFRVFNKASFRWENYGFIQEFTFIKENGNWKIITSGDKKALF